MSRKRLTPTIIDALAEAHRHADSYAILSEKFGVSEGSVRNALVAAAAQRAARASAAAPAQVGDAAQVADDDEPDDLSDPRPTDPHSLEDLRGMLGEQISAIRDDLALQGITPNERSTLSRTLGNLVALSGRLTPPAVADPNDNPDMVALGKRVAADLHRYVDQVEGAEGPACPMCNRPTSIPEGDRP